MKMKIEHTKTYEIQQKSVLGGKLTSANARRKDFKSIT